MGFNNIEISFLSSDGQHTLRGDIYVPTDTEILGVVQLAHGMTDHVGRYGALARYLTDRGYVFAGHCHLGHGKSAVSEDELGYFAPRRGAELVVRDMHLMNALLRERFSGIPVVVLGHSMGSFIARIYAELYPEDVNGLIIHGTGGPSGVVSAGKVLVGAMSLVRGKKYRSSFIKRLASRGYNKKFPKEEGPNAWLTRDAKAAEEKRSDPLGNYTFTLSAYNDLFTLVKRANSKKWFDNFSKTMPTLIVSGDMDPVGGFGKGVLRVHGELSKRGHGALTLKLYCGARHELFNETNKEEIFGDIVTWLGGIRK